MGRSTAHLQAATHRLEEANQGGIELPVPSSSMAAEVPVQEMRAPQIAVDYSHQANSEHVLCAMLDSPISDVASPVLSIDTDQLGAEAGADQLRQASVPGLRESTENSSCAPQCESPCDEGGLVQSVYSMCVPQLANGPTSCAPVPVSCTKCPQMTFACCTASLNKKLPDYA